MSLLQLVSREARAPRSTILVMAVVSGGANVMMLAIVNGAVERAAAGAAQISLLILYLITLGIYAVSQQYTRTRSISAITVALQDLRLRLAEKLRRSELQLIESNRDNDGFLAAWSDAASLLNGTTILVSVSQSTLLMGLAGIYLALLSPVSIGLILLICVVVVPIYLNSWRPTLKKMEEVDAIEREIAYRQDNVILGSEQHQLDQPENDQRFVDLHRQIHRAHRLRAALAKTQAQGAAVWRVASYAVPFTVVFFVPMVVPATGDTILKIAVTSLLAVGALVIVSDMLPMLVRFNAAVRKLYELEKQIDMAQPDQAETQLSEVQAGFKVIEWSGIEYQYSHVEETQGFRLGPLDLRVQRGELVYIVGGNSAGKSTLVKLLTGLYPPGQGTLYVDGQPLGRGKHSAYPRLFTAVFSDGHALSSPCVGGEYPFAAWETMIEQLNLVDLAGPELNQPGGWLSPGQRKRQAFVAAALSGHPVCIFDDLGVGLDPLFRRRLHEQSLPRLTALGRTLILVSSDLQYSHCADRVLCLRDGVLQESV